MVINTECDCAIKQLIDSIDIGREGEEWRKSRSVMDKKLLKMKDIAAYSDRMNQVISDLIAYIKRKQVEDNLNGEMANIQDALYKWSFESKMFLVVNYIIDIIRYLLGQLFLSRCTILLSYCIQINCFIIEMVKASLVNRMLVIRILIYFI